MDYTIENDVKSGSNSCARPDFKHQSNSKTTCPLPAAAMLISSDVNLHPALVQMRVTLFFDAAIAMLISSEVSFDLQLIFTPFQLFSIYPRLL